MADLPLATPSSLETVLSTAAVEMIVPSGLVVRMSDLHGLYGGTTYQVFGDARPGAGRLEIEQVDRVRTSTVAERALDDDALRELVGLLVEARVWDDALPARMPVPDETILTLAVQAEGASGGCFELLRDGEANDRLIRIWRWLEAVGAQS